MRLGVLLLVVFGLGACTRPIPAPSTQPTTNDGNVPPLISPPLKPRNTESLDNLKRYRDTLVAYHNYLTGYINYISATSGLVEPFEQQKGCGAPFPIIDITLPSIPKIRNLDPSDAVDRLVEHIEVLRNKIVEHNRQLGEIRKQRAENCAE